MQTTTPAAVARLPSPVFGKAHTYSASPQAGPTPSLQTVCPTPHTTKYTVAAHRHGVRVERWRQHTQPARDWTGHTVHLHPNRGAHSRLCTAGSSRDASQPGPAGGWPRGCLGCQSKSPMRFRGANNYITLGTPSSCVWPHHPLCFSTTVRCTNCVAANPRGWRPNAVRIHSGRWRPQRLHHYTRQRMALGEGVSPRFWPQCPAPTSGTKPRCTCCPRLAPRSAAGHPGRGLDNWQQPARAAGAVQ